VENNADAQLDRVKQLLLESNELVEHISALTNERAQLDPLPGSLRARHMQCGKQRCRCKTGSLHGPYYYFEPSRQHGKWRYVSRDRLGDVKRGVADWKKQQEIDETLQTYSERLEAVLKAIQQEIASVIAAP